MQSYYSDEACKHVDADLVAFEVGPAAGREALLTAEALEFGSHAEGVALHSLLLAPHAHDLHVLHVLHCTGGGGLIVMVISIGIVLIIINITIISIINITIIIVINITIIIVNITILIIIFTIIVIIIITILTTIIFTSLLGSLVFNVYLTCPQSSGQPSIT